MIVPVGRHQLRSRGARRPESAGVVPPGSDGPCPAFDPHLPTDPLGRLRVHKESKVDATGLRYRSTQDCPGSGENPGDQQPYATDGSRVGRRGDR